MENPISALVQPIMLRMTTYIFSLVIGLIPAAAIAYVSVVFNPATQILSIDVNVGAIVTSLISAVVLSGGVLWKFGKK
jgi:hypothetical protein